MASRKSPADYTALEIKSRPSFGDELSFRTSLAKVGGLRADSNCCKQTDRQTLRKCIYRHISCKFVKAKCVLSYHMTRTFQVL